VILAPYRPVSAALAKLGAPGGGVHAAFGVEWHRLPWPHYQVSEVWGRERDGPAATETPGRVDVASAVNRSRGTQWGLSASFGGNMAWRKTGLFHPAEEVLLLTCDVCER